MKIERIDHIAILVKNLEKAERFFGELFETKFTVLGERSEFDIRNAIDPSGIELVASLLSDGEMAEVIRKRGEGVFPPSL